MRGAGGYSVRDAPGIPAAAQSDQGRPDTSEEAKQYKVLPSNLGNDLVERLNALAANGWHVMQRLPSNGVNSGTHWAVYEK